MMRYAVIDTNVLVSALLSSHKDAATVQVVDKIFIGEVIPLFSEDILQEYNEVLRRTKFPFPEERIAMLIGTIQKYGELVMPSPTGEILPDIKDLPFYEVVMEKRADNAYLITGNVKHFPNQSFIVTARDFLNVTS